MKESHSRYWQYYIAYLVLSILTALYEIIFQGGASKPMEIFDTICLLITTVGVCGFVFEKRILFYYFWRCYLFIAIGCVLLIAKNAFVGEELTGVFVAALITYAALVVPAIIAIFLYGFRCKDIWS